MNFAIDNQLSPGSIANKWRDDKLSFIPINSLWTYLYFWRKDSNEAHPEISVSETIYYFFRYYMLLWRVVQFFFC